MWAWCRLHLTAWFKRLPHSVVLKFGKGVPEQLSSSSSDNGSKLQGTPQSSPRVATKRNVHIVPNMKSRFLAMLVLRLGREFYMGKYGI
ncbi:hypothetical protein AVEN_92206-1 [Araneus ventricosus]|uniref:Uncharacterized protein n=1 Tax=Araneus ventricosus TaxID=182803 RepID=A0A4Y2AM08_ARAVE|nr:hypothetical protein AVEN_92206-1 [Araneus ventricosus]